MTLNQFVDKYNNQTIDFGNGFGFQCYNLAVQYLFDMGWLPNGFYPYCPSGGVRDMIERYDEIPVLKNNGVEKIDNNPDPNHIPQSGDVVIYGWGEYGHIEVVIEANTGGMRTIGQNIGNGDGQGWDDRTQIVENRGYNGVIGWLRKQKKNEESQKSLDTNLKLDELNREMNKAPYFDDTKKRKVVKDYLEKNSDELVNEIIEAGKKVDILRIEKTQLENANVQLIKSAELGGFAIQRTNAVVKPSEQTEQLKMLLGEEEEPVVEIKRLESGKADEIVSKITKSPMFNISKKLVVTIITAIVVTFNNKLGLDLDINSILALIGLSSSYVVGQSAVDIQKNKTPKY
jgi:hypothetical protein